MYDYYLESFRPRYRHQGQMQSMAYPSYDDYDDCDERVLDNMQRQLVKAFRLRKHHSDSDSENDNNDLEKATRAHIEATLEYEKLKEQFDDAKKKLEECEEKVQAAAKQLEKAKKRLCRRCIDF